jgi:hypothetical protein
MVEKSTAEELLPSQTFLLQGGRWRRREKERCQLIIHNWELQEGWGAGCWGLPLLVTMVREVPLGDKLWCLRAHCRPG